MSEELPVTVAAPKSDVANAYLWLGQILTNFARAEQAIGQLCLALDLSIKNGPLCSVNELKARLDASEDRRCHNLSKRIERWRSLRPVRHILAHGTVQVLYDEKRLPVFVTRHLPLDKEDATPDRVWTATEQSELLRISANDGRSIQDQVRNLLQDGKALAALGKP